MGFSTDTATGQEMAEGGNYLEDEGTFHAAVVKAEAPPLKDDGTLIDGGVVKVSLSTLEGTTRDKGGNFTNKGKQYDLTLFEPDLSSKDQGKMNRKKITALLIAMGELTEANAGASVDVDEQKWPGRQLLLTTEKWTNSEGKTRLNLRFDNLYHVDHPAVAGIPKDQSALKAIPANFRRPNYVAELEAVKSNGSNSNGNGSNAGQPQQQAQQPAGTAAGSAGQTDDLDDLL